MFENERKLESPACDWNKHKIRCTSQQARPLPEVVMLRRRGTPSIWFSFRFYGSNCLCLLMDAVFCFMANSPKNPMELPMAVLAQGEVSERKEV